MIDLHNHSLYGIDDGSRTYEESLEIIRGLSDHGVTDIFLTPHYIAGTNQASPRFENTNRYNYLRAAVRHQRIPVNLYLGNEIYIDRDIEKLIRFGQLKTLGDSNYLLIELPMSGEYADYEGIFLQLIKDGYKVILAHPERYTSFQKDYNRILELNSIGVLFQCNLGSIIDQYGKEARKTLIKMIRDDLVFAFGTDIHHVRDFKEIDRARDILEKYYEDDLGRVLTNNPRSIIA
ncbi:MAG: hypothetical protein Q4A25_00965 [Candidatus Saccharibacteria bacterium]|nr:hypothetical protein [Candidatus Saccharibacteria bacterium]